MINYADFEASVQRTAPNDFANWRHLLPAIPLEFRHRFLQTMTLGLDIPTSFDYVMRGRRLPDEDYRSLLREVGIERAHQEDLQSQLLAKLVSVK